MILVVSALASMLLLHERHYEQREFRLLRARVNEIEAILTEDRRV